jgi:hypothetical protein
VIQKKRPLLPRAVDKRWYRARRLRIPNNPVMAASTMTVSAVIAQAACRYTILILAPSDCSPGPIFATTIAARTARMNQKKGDFREDMRDFSLT